jgi:hypothetical protein
LKGFGVEEQAGSTPGKGFSDATFSLKTALQNLREHGQESWVLFVDLVKAYDKDNREMLWKILEILGVPNSLIEVLKKLYTDFSIDLRVGEDFEQFLSSSDVKQGDNLTHPSSHHSRSSQLTRQSLDKNGNAKSLTFDGIRILKLENREGS